MTYKSILFAGIAALAITGCGNKEASGSSPNSKQSSSSISALKASSGSPFDKAFKLSNASAIDIDAMLAQSGYDGPKPYGAVTFDSKLGATIISDLKFDDGDGNIITIAKAELFGVDQEAIDRVINGTASIDAPFETVLQKVRLYDVNVDVNEAKTSIDIDGDTNNLSADLDGNIGTFEMSLAGLEIDTLKIRQGGVDESLGEATMVAQAFNVFDLGGLYFKDYKIKFGGEEFGSFKLNAPDFRVVGLGGGKLDALIANDLDYTFKQSREALAEAFASAGPQAAAFLDGPLGAIMGLDGQRVLADTMTWNNIDASNLLEYGLKGEMPPMSAKNLLRLGKGEMLGFEQYIGDKKLLTAKSSTFEMDKFTWLVPNLISTDVKDATYDLTAYVPSDQEELLGIMTKHGLDNVKGEGEFVWNYDDKAGTAKLDYNGTTDKFADFSMTMDAGALKYDEIASLVEAEDQAGLAGLGQFKNFNLKLTDKNLLNMAYDIAALQMGAGSGDDLRQSAPAMLRLSSGQVTAINPIFQDYVSALATFLGEGGTLEISANPDEAIPFMQLGIVGQTAPQTLPDVLGLTVTHKK